MCKDPSNCTQLDPSAKKKLANIWYLIGLAWQCGDGLDENEKMAIDSFRKAARYGNPEAMRCLADYCIYRDRDLMRAIGWWLLAFRIDLDSTEPETEHGESETVRQYRKAAERGCAGAQARLGECCFIGKGTDQNKKEAVRWFRKAAAQSNAMAMFRLGCCYLVGDRVKKNEAKAYRLWHRSARLGYAEAQYYIGLCYEFGDHVERNHDEALKWLRMAAAQGHRDAQHELSR